MTPTIVSKGTTDGRDLALMPRGNPEGGYIRVRWDGASAVMDGVDTCWLGSPVPGREAPWDGSFAYWEWVDGRLTAGVDRFGVFPLYYFLDGNTIAVSDSIVTLLSLGAPAHVDWEALAVLLHWGGLVGNDTPFAAIRVLPPGGVLEWESGRHCVRAPDLSVPESRLTRDQAIEGFIELTASALADRRGERAVLPLSGGRDSRHLLLRLVESGSPPDLCITAGQLARGALGEASVARQLSQRAGVEHRVVPGPPCRVHSEARKNLEIGFSSLMHHWYLAVVDAAMAADARTAYDGLQLLPFGHSGWIDEGRVRLLREGRLRALAEKMILAEGSANGTWLQVIPSTYRDQIRPEVARDRLARELCGYEHWPNPIGAFLVFNRTRRAVGNQLFSLWPRTVTVHCPFMDHRVFTHLLSLPAEITMGSDFHTDAIHRAFPRYADIPFSEPLPRLPNARAERRSAWRLLWLLLQNLDAPLVDHRFMVPRVLRAALDPSYSHNVRWLATMGVYAVQLGQRATFGGYDPVSADSSLGRAVGSCC